MNGKLFVREHLMIQNSHNAEIEGFLNINRSSCHQDRVRYISGYFIRLINSY